MSSIQPLKDPSFQNASPVDSAAGDMAPAASIAAISEAIGQLQPLEESQMPSLAPAIRIEDCGQNVDGLNSIPYHGGAGRILSDDSGKSSKSVISEPSTSFTLSNISDPMAESNIKPDMLDTDELGSLVEPHETEIPGSRDAHVPEAPHPEPPSQPIHDVSSLARPVKGGIDPCADPEFVEVLKVAKQLDAQEEAPPTFRRASTRRKTAITPFASFSAMSKATKSTKQKKPIRVVKQDMDDMEDSIKVKVELMEEEGQKIVVQSKNASTPPSRPITSVKEEEIKPPMATKRENLSPKLHSEDTIKDDNSSDLKGNDSETMAAEIYERNRSTRKRKAPIRFDGNGDTSLKIKREKMEESNMISQDVPRSIGVSNEAVPIDHEEAAKDIQPVMTPTRNGKIDRRKSLQAQLKRIETLRKKKIQKQTRDMEDALARKRAELAAKKEAVIMFSRRRSLPSIFPHQHNPPNILEHTMGNPYMSHDLKPKRAVSIQPQLRDTSIDTFPGRSRSVPPLQRIRKFIDHYEAEISHPTLALQGNTSRAFTEELLTYPSSKPWFLPQEVIHDTPRKRRARPSLGSRSETVKKRTSTKRRHVDADLESDRPKQAQRPRTVIILSETESSLSDALDISDSDVSMDEDECLLSLWEGKLTRAEQRPKLRIARIRRHKKKKVAKKRRVSKTWLALREDQIAKENPMGYDRRYHPDAVRREGDKWMTPTACFRCLQVRQFCDRSTPCSNCSRAGHACERKDGWVVASKGKSERGAIVYSDVEDSISSEPDDETEDDTPQITKVRKAPKSSKPATIKKVPHTPNSKKAKTIKIKEEKRRISNAITSRQDPECIWIEKPHPQAKKPPCIGKPEVWCTNRQELCESLPYFRSYQSGTYHNGGVMRGYLMDGCAGPRDFANGRIVISHSGGKSATDEDGSRRLVTSQLETSAVVRDLMNNLRGKWPLILIMGDQCATSPSKIPHRYCVMDWFKVTAAWAEKDVHTDFVRWMFRFEKLHSDKLGWWAAPDEGYVPSAPMEMLKACCKACQGESPRVYEIGWMCLKPECVEFWKLNGESPKSKLAYDHSFINCHTPWDHNLELPPAPLRPPLATDRDNYFDGGDVARVYWKGMCCPNCGRLNCREKWAGWACRGCDFKSNPPRTIFEADRLADPHRAIFTGPAIPSNIVQPGISWTRTVQDGMTCLTYHLKDCGTITHILASEHHNKREYCADWLFKEYQAPDMPFKRYALKSHKVQGQLLTQQFSFNAGAPYKYIVAVDSTPFDQAPRAVTRSLEVLQERVRLVHPEAEFNEVLSVGYFEGQKMDYHDDGEEDLGETVASISLGAPAKMKFRVKAKHMSTYKLWEPKTAPKAIKVEPGVIQDVIMPEVPQPEDGDPDEEEERPGGAPGIPGKKDFQKSARVKLELRLNHGDVVVMKGREIQRIWEHAVQPIGLFRVAATARWIKPSKPTASSDNQHPPSSPIANFGTTLEILEKDLPVQNSSDDTEDELKVKKEAGFVKGEGDEEEGESTDTEAEDDGEGDEERSEGGDEEGVEAEEEEAVDDSTSADSSEVDSDGDSPKEEEEVEEDDEDDVATMQVDVDMEGGESNKEESGHDSDVDMDDKSAIVKSEYGSSSEEDAMADMQVKLEHSNVRKQAEDEEILPSVEFYKPYSQ